MSKTVNISNFESYIVDYFDGKLSESEQQALFAFLETHPQLMADFELFKQSGTLRLVPDKTVIFNDKRRLKHNAFRLSAVAWISVASLAAVLLLFFLFRPNAEIPSTSVTPEPVFVQTADNEPETSSDTTNNEPPIEKPVPQKIRSETPVIADANPEEELAPEHLPFEQNTEVAASDFTEIIRVLEPDVVVIKTISEYEPEQGNHLTVNQIPPQKNRSLWKVLSWGVKQYNAIANDDIAIVKVENLSTNETVYYLCRGE